MYGVIGWDVISCAAFCDVVEIVVVVGSGVGIVLCWCWCCLGCLCFVVTTLVCVSLVTRMAVSS